MHLALFEPRSGRIPVILAIAWAAVTSAVFYTDTPVQTLWIPVVVSLLPLTGFEAELGIALRGVSGGLLVVWVVLAALSVGEFYIPAAVLMFVGCSRAAKWVDAGLDVEQT